MLLFCSFELESSSSPPLLAEKRLHWMSLYEDYFLWTGDMFEEFIEKAKRDGLQKARLWYVFQATKTANSNPVEVLKNE
jgi:hypothetical protein